MQKPKLSQKAEMGSAQFKKEWIFALSCLMLVMLPMATLRIFSHSALSIRMRQAFSAAGSRNQHRWIGYRDNLHSGVESLASRFVPISRSTNFSIEELTDLYSILNKAAFRNKTVIITTLNQAWAAPDSMIDLFLQSFAAGEGISSFLHHMLIVCLDQVSAERCETIPHVHCFTLRTYGVDFSGEKFFMSEDYLRMMWRRIEFLRVVLEMGFDFIFSDADILWFRDPFPYLSDDADFEIACDQYYGDPYALYNRPNGGYVHVRSRNRTIEFYKFWYKARHLFPGKHDQDVLNKIKNSPNFGDIGLKLRFLSTEIFSGFCQVSRNFDKVVTMHANCCTGLARKLNDLRLAVEDWRRFKLMRAEERQSRRVFWRAPKECLHSFHG